MSNPTPTPAPVERKAWTADMAPAYIGVFLWVAFLDEIGRRALPVGGLLPSVLGVGVAGVLGYLLLFRPPALWGFASRKPLDGLAAATLGRWGSGTALNLAIVVGQMAIFAVGLGYAGALMLGGLEALEYIPARSLRPVMLGSAKIPAPLFMVTTLGWGLITATVGATLVRWIGAIMQYFPVFPALALGLTMLGGVAGLARFEPTGVDPATRIMYGFADGAWAAAGWTFRWVFGFSALLGLNGASWGAAAPTLGDVRKGGLFSMAFVPVALASVALLAVAGAEGVRASSGLAAPSAAPSNLPARGQSISAIADLSNAPKADPTIPNRSFTLRGAITSGFSPRVTALISIVLGLAALAPACFAAHDFSRRLSIVGPGLTPFWWSVVAGVAGWMGVMGGWHVRVDLIFSAMGIAFAPVAGAIAAEASRRRRDDLPEPPPVAWPGMVGWGLGVAAGLALLATNRPAFSNLSAIGGFGVGFTACWILGSMRGARSVPSGVVSSEPGGELDVSPPGS